MALITLAEFKKYLQITDDAYDAGYATFIEAVSDDIQDIANQFFNLQYAVNVTENSQYLPSAIEQYDVFEGVTVTGDGIPDNTIVQNARLYQIEMNKYATATATDVTVTYNAVPEKIKPVIAQMVMYKIKTSTYTAGGNVKDVKSRSYGQVSVTLGDGAAVDKTWGYPRNLVKSIKRIRRLALDKGELRRSGENITNKERELYRH